MKRILLLTILLSCFFISFGQLYSITGLQVSLGDLIRNSSGRIVKDNIVQTFNGETEGSQFYFSEFTEGMVISNTKDTFNKVYLFLFDKVNQQLYLIDKKDRYAENPVLTQVRKDQVLKFMLKQKKEAEHWFVAARLYDRSNLNDFYEVLEQRDSGYTFMKKIETTFTPSSTNNVADLMRGDNKAQFHDKFTYFISFKSGIPVAVEIKRRKITEAFPSTYKSYIDTYFLNHDQDEIDDHFVVGMINAINRQFYP